MPENEAGERRDILRTPEIEAREMEQLIARGHQAHNVVGALTFIGIVILFLGGLYYDKLDRLGVGDSPLRYSEYLDKLVENQADKEYRAYQSRGAIPVPKWPGQLYAKLRQDLYILCGAALLLSLVFIHIEKAKLRRSDLLVYRALAREIEKLRARVKELEGKGGGGGAARDADTEGHPKASETPTETDL